MAVRCLLECGPRAPDRPIHTRGRTDREVDGLYVAPRTLPVIKGRNKTKKETVYKEKKRKKKKKKEEKERDEKKGTSKVSCLLREMKEILQIEKFQ